MATVLMVEDEEQIRVLAESVLQEAGHKVVTATGIEGAKALLDTDQQIDVLFLDLNLGGDPEAGLMVAQQAQARRPKLSYLYTTGAGVNAGMKAMFVEPFLFLPKPYTFEQLTKSVAFLMLAASPRPIKTCHNQTENFLPLGLGGGGASHTIPPRLVYRLLATG